ncbi:MAG: ribosome biogenesis GTPase Der [Deltaproteobacteria bacterium]|nr:ribosome biogenesis GTPase Der [Deltaproteobacteria bacterium]
MRPIVAIVGRPNVGKSTLFNRLIGRRKAIVYDEPGVTRDVNYADVEERGRFFTLVDTGGFSPEPPIDSIGGQVREQMHLAIEEADVIILLMDGRSGVLPQDMELVEMLRRVPKPVIYAVNKIDTEGQEAAFMEFHSLGVKDLMAISAEGGRNLDEIADLILGRLPPYVPAPPEEERIRVAIVGRPNVGKSSLLNRLINRKRAIVSAVAGTTRDPVDTPFDLDGKRYLFIDTAGIRKKDRVSLRVESYCVMEAIKAIDRCDAAILVIDGKAGVEGQDERIAGLIEDRKKCCILAINKWDIVEKETMTSAIAEEKIREKLPFITYAPVVFISALTGQRTSKIFSTIDGLVLKSRTRIPTSRLNKALEEFSAMHGAPSYRGKEVKFYYITQTGTSPAVFTVFTNWPEGIKDSHKRFIVNRLRETLGLDNVPIRLIFRKRR